MTDISVPETVQTTSPSITPTPDADAKTNNGASKNALTHGLYAKDIVIAGERSEDFETIHELTRAEFFVDGPTEEAQAAEIAVARVQMNRLNRHYARWGALSASTPTLKKGDAIVSGKTSDLKAFIKTIDEYAKETGIYEILKNDHHHLLKNGGDIELTPRQQEVVKALYSAAGSRIDPAEVFEPFCQDFEKYLKLTAMLNTRIEKAINRLAIIKEYKRMYSRKEVQSIQPPTTTA
jgi:hypothetical protein